MTSTRLRTGALCSAVLLLAAAPAGAATRHASELGPGCERSTDRRITCTYRSPTAHPVIVDVPDGVTSARMTVRGGAGGAGSITTPIPQPPGLTVVSPGGAGGTATAAIALDPYRHLEVRVGSAGQAGAEGGTGGVGSGPGGDGIASLLAGTVDVRGGGGGGGSEVRVAGTNPTYFDPLIAAGGGGGGGSGILPDLHVAPAVAAPGGAGGGTQGADAPSIGLTDGLTIAGGGLGATETAAGGGGACLPSAPLFKGVAGARGTGGDAGEFEAHSTASGFGGGGGGGGFYGGGGGCAFSGGGGGSGFGPASTQFGTGPEPVAPSGAATLIDGEVVIVFDPPEDAPPRDGSRSRPAFVSVS